MSNFIPLKSVEKKSVVIQSFPSGNLVLESNSTLLRFVSSVIVAPVRSTPLKPELSKLVPERSAPTNTELSKGIWLAEEPLSLAFVKFVYFA